MLPNDLSHSLNPKIWPTGSHRRFREKYLYLNGACCLLHLAKEELHTALVRQIRHVERNAGPFNAYTIGMVTAAAEAGDGLASVSGFHMAKSEAWRIAGNMSEFLAVVQRQTIVGANRIMIDYCFDLIHELDKGGVLQLPAARMKPLRSRRADRPDLMAALRDIGLPLARDKETEGRLELFALTRNAIEHNDGKVTKNWLRYSKRTDLSVGDRIPFTSEMASDALDLVDHLVNALNAEAFKRHPSALDRAPNRIPGWMPDLAILVVDFAHSLTHVPCGYAVYNVPPCPGLRLSTTEFVKQHGSFDGCDEIQLVLGESVYGAALTNVGPTIDLTAAELKPLNSSAVFPGLLPGANCIVGIGRRPQQDTTGRLFEPRWSAAVYVDSVTLD